MARVVIVIPCFNEAKRLRLSAFADYLATHPATEFLFVDDGSTDATAKLLDDFRQLTGERVGVLKLIENQGKAEAVRQGLLQAMTSSADHVGFWDADLATPLATIDQFREVLDQRPDIDWVFGSRVRLLGRSIDRIPTRHYLGRVWATAVSLLLRLPIYDTQCGAKLFRASEELRRLLAAPFRTRWVFDVELIARLLCSRRQSELPGAERAIYELPLSEWRDVAGSKLKPRDFWMGGIELIKIYLHYLRGMDVHSSQDRKSPGTNTANAQDRTSACCVAESPAR